PPPQAERRDHHDCKTERRPKEYAQHEARTNENQGLAPQVVPAPSGETVHEATHKATSARRAAHGDGMGAVSVIVLAAFHTLDGALCLQCARVSPIDGGRSASADDPYL
ncbi:MAG TPA: hypothetical protein VM822_03085, partial [Pseudolabrys sp.]|nr:hypothetical protein [Pseudolabrys sp.]